MKIIDDFLYRRPSTLDEALGLLDEFKDTASPLAGGTDLVVNMKHRSNLQLFEGAGTPNAKWPAAGRVPPVAKPEAVISLALLKELKRIEKKGATWHVGPTATMSKIAATSFPGSVKALADAAGIMGSPLIRNLATIGGNIINGRPAADTAIAAVALDGDLKLASKGETRTIKASQFFKGPGKTERRGDELLVDIEIAEGKGEGSAYVRHGTRRQLEIAIVSAAAWLKLEGGAVKDARICLGAVAPTPILAPKAAASLIGKTADWSSLKSAAEIARTEAKPIDDFRGSAEYRLELVEVLVGRALEKAAARAAENGGRS